ncbi:carbohydrate ABC transporter permease [Cohnella cellulosilytica]|uniref:Carbohydrate ABC transporter permease n=1 Tax=Cohnella cellulosilytica TaxID=986710 RepID=A0ABW2FIK1_9BACL
MSLLLRNRRIGPPLYYVFLCCFGLIMLYPLIWLLLASVKPSHEIFAGTGLWPSEFVFSSYWTGWKSAGQVGFETFTLNSLRLVIPVVAFTLISSLTVAYGFARFNFVMKKTFFGLMIIMLMLPSSVIIIPRYLLFRDLGWINTYLPFIVPAIFATSSFFIFMFIQFFRGLPRELDESAKVDGYGSLRILIYILMPLCKPVIISGAIFQFIWTWNDFFDQLIYINSVSKFTVSLGLRMSLDTSQYVEWNQLLAMSIVAILPCVIVFFMAQKYFVEGISTTGMKG